MSFSERYGFVPVKALQNEAVDKDLTNGLWQALSENYFRSFSTSTSYSKKDSRFYFISSKFFVDYLKLASDRIPSGRADCISAIRKLFFDAVWYKKLDIIEFCGSSSMLSDHQDLVFQARVNFFLEREKSAFRFVGSHIARIADPLEIESIETVFQNDEKYTSAKNHIKQALALYSDRASPDYRNTIKEAISGVEAACRIVSGEHRATLGSALKAISNTRKIHPSIAQAWNKLYGYTSDEGGIRHSMLEVSSIDEFDALYMIVICSAFINYVAALDVVPHSQGPNV